MTSRTEILKRYKLTTIFIRPDKRVHMLTAEQTGGSPENVFYQKQSGSDGSEAFLGRGTFGLVHLEHETTGSKVAPELRAVKTISKALTAAASVNWEHEIVNLIILAKVRFTALERQFPSLIKF
jgi:hypothetical protein